MTMRPGFLGYGGFGYIHPVLGNFGQAKSAYTPPPGGPPKAAAPRAPKKGLTRPGNLQTRPVLVPKAKAKAKAKEKKKEKEKEKAKLKPAPPAPAVRAPTGPQRQEFIAQRRAVISEFVLAQEAASRIHSGRSADWHGDAGTIARLHASIQTKLSALSRHAGRGTGPRGKLPALPSIPGSGLQVVKPFTAHLLAAPSGSYSSSYYPA